MGHASIERELHVEAAPDVVYEVISRPEHLREWWPDEAELDAVPGSTGVISFGEAKVVHLTVTEADPPRRFAFLWTYDEDVVASTDNALLVTFELSPAGAGTLLRFTETGFATKGWAGAELEEKYAEHATAWDHFLPRLAGYVRGLARTP
ncbi:SRPBCC domain-containing protein [Pseudonocardia sp. CA-107938]|uniref:SRPBCC domain-containing protein n=1 Tax=Pseudonocardia sp. CA-107938 TaxID=3240021 RepID=UPI003D8DC8F8